jgi:hypothetical protein
MKPTPLVRPDDDPSPPPPPPSPPPVGTPWGAIGPLPHAPPPADLHATVLDFVSARTAIEVPALVRDQPMSCTIGATASPTLLLLSIVGVGALLCRVRRRRAGSLT